MRFFSGSMASLLLVMLVIGCSWVDADECWVNTSGGLGGAGMIPIGAGVGATTSGDFLSPPPGGPLDYGGKPNPCVTPESQADAGSPGDGAEMGTYIRCRGLGATACAEQCRAIGAYCVELATHPKNPSIGIGGLKQCMENLASYTCTYCYDNGDVCTFIYTMFGLGWGDCTNTRGKGCE